MQATKPKRIELGSKMMREAYARGTDYYQPTMDGCLLEVEGGTTDTSVANLKLMIERCGCPHAIEQGPNQGFFFHFAVGETYLATGFGVGYGGTGPNGLATILMEMGLKFRSHSRFDDHQESPEHNSRQVLLSLIGDWDSEFVGHIFNAPMPIRALWRSDDAPNKLMARGESEVSVADFELLEPIQLFGRLLARSWHDPKHKHAYFAER